MTLPVLPGNIIRGIKRNLHATSTITRSVFSGHQTAQDWGGRYWVYEIELATLTGERARKVDAFFNALGGVAGSFVMIDPTALPQPNVGQPQIAGAGQTGTTLTVNNWGEDGKIVARTGDIFSVGTDKDAHLYQLTQDVTSAVSGNNTVINFVPALRAPSLDKAPLEFAAPQIVLRQERPVISRIATADHFKFSFTATEVL